MNFPTENFSLYRNYFLGKAIGAQNVRTANFALQGLKLLEDYHLVVLDTAASSGSQLQFNLVNAFSHGAKAKSLISAVYYNLADPSATTDIKKSAALVNEKKSIAVDTSIQKDMAWGSYQILFVVENADGKEVYIRASLHLKPKIYEGIAVSFAQTATWKSPAEYQVSEGWPVVFEALNTNQNPVIHLQIDAQFAGDQAGKDRPATVYAILSREGQVPYSFHADYVAGIQRYQIDADLAFMI